MLILAIPEPETLTSIGLVCTVCMLAERLQLLLRVSQIGGSSVMADGEAKRPRMVKNKLDDRLKVVVL